MRVLITNDDGITAPGLRALAAAVRAVHPDVVVAAPAREYRGDGASLHAELSGRRLPVTPSPLSDVDMTFAVPASPAYIVILATLGAFGPPPDVVLAGINRGANVSHAVLHSGTVGAALT